MFRNAAVEPAANDRPGAIATPPEALIPISHLELDLPAPPEGWAGFFAARDIPVQADDLGRASVARSVARMLFAERRELEARAAELRAEQEARFVEEDQRWRAQLPKGTPWWQAVGLSAAQAMMQAEHANRPKSVHQQLLEDALSGGGSTVVYQPFEGAGES